jgi:dihydropteroate synthase
MGVLNVTPDSFSDGGSYFQASAALQHAQEMAAGGSKPPNKSAASCRCWSF